MSEPFIKVPLNKLLASSSQKLLGFTGSGGSGSRGGSGAMQRDGLPVTEPELIAQCQREYEEAAQHGGQEALDACFRLSWALVHSPRAEHMERGTELAEALTHDQRGHLEQRDLLYLVAVGRYRQRRYIEARRTLKGLLQAHPDFRQAETLLEACDKEILKDGLVGLGAGAAVVGAIAAIAVAAMRR